LKIGFVDCITNDYDVYGIAVDVAAKTASNVSLSRFTAPDILKVPVCCKKLLEAGADVGLVFLNLEDEDADSFNLLLEKNVDVELETGKFVFFCVVNRADYRTPEQLGEIAAKKLAAFIELIVKLELNPNEISKQIGSELPPELAGLGAGIASLTGGQASETQTPIEVAENTVFGEQAPRPLF
jgi:riboflavin synthase